MGRGVVAGHRENTVSSFLAAAEVAPWVEIDVRRTADDVLVVHHDPVLSDGTPVAEAWASQAVADGLTLLTEVLGSLPAQTGVCFDVKSALEDAILPRRRTTGALLVPIARAAARCRPTLVSSFDPAVVGELAELAPEIPRGLLTWIGFPIEMAVAAASRLGAQVVAVHVDSLEPKNERRRAQHPGLARTVRVAHEAGLEVFAWCPDICQAKRLAAAGVDALCVNDLPDATVAFPVTNNDATPRSPVLYAAARSDVKNEGQGSMSEGTTFGSTRDRAVNRLRRSARQAAVTLVPHLGRGAGRVVIATTRRVGGSAHGYASALLRAADEAAAGGSLVDALSLARRVQHMGDLPDDLRNRASAVADAWAHTLLQQALAVGDEKRARAHLGRVLPQLSPDRADDLIDMFGAAEMWPAFVDVVEDAQIPADVREGLMARAISVGRADAVRALMRSGDDSSVVAYRLGRAYEQEQRWGQAAAALHYAVTLDPDKPAWRKRFHRLELKAPSWGFEPAPFGPAWNSAAYPEMRSAGVVAPVHARPTAGWLPDTGDGDNHVVFKVNGADVADTYATTPVTLPDNRSYLQFTRWLGDLWAALGKGDTLTVHARGHVLPIIESGPEHVVASGSSQAGKLIAMLKDGHVIDKAGKLRKSIRLDREWQKAVETLFTKLHDDVHDGTGHSVFPFFGSLLGAVRDHDFIGNDNDFDAAYISNYSTPEQVRKEFKELCAFLISQGYSVEARRTCAWIRMPGIDTKIDLFYSWFTNDGLFTTSYGHHGPPARRKDEFFERRTERLGDMEFAVPANAEEILAQLYGPTWRQPDPGFLHQGSTRVIDPRYHLRDSDITDVHWREFYRDHDPAAASPFARFISDQLTPPGVVIEFGCGTGRDSLHLAAQGWSVLGTDRAREAIDRAEAAAQRFNGSSSIRFDTADAASAADVRSCLARHEEFLQTDNLVVYLRFFLHAIEETVERTLFKTLAGALSRGFTLCAEFRTVEDRALAKAYGSHYRRYIDHERLAKRLSDEHGFHVGYLEAGHGFSPHDGEDPHLARLIARLPARQP
jgi:glycerophosphoryl diester phosphodiesterase